MKLHAKLGRLIKAERQKLNLTQLEVSHELGYDSAQFLSLMERGISKVPRPVMKKLISILDLNRSEMIQLIQADFVKTLKEEI